MYSTYMYFIYYTVATQMGIEIGKLVWPAYFKVGLFPANSRTQSSYYLLCSYFTYLEIGFTLFGSPPTDPIPRETKKLLVYYIS